MKKFSKLMVALALMLVIAVPMLFAGCGSNNENKTNVASVSVKTSFKSEYNIGDKLDVSDGKILVKYSDDSEKVVEITKDMVSSFNTATAGQKQMIITYEGKTVLVDYYVNPHDISVGDLFYGAVTGLSSPYESADHHDYLYIYSNKLFGFLATNVTKENIMDYLSDFNKITVNRSIVNNKVTYTYTDEVGQLVFTVVDKNTVSYVATAPGQEYGQGSGTLIKIN